MRSEKEIRQRLKELIHLPYYRPSYSNELGQIHALRWVLEGD